MIINLHETFENRIVNCDKHGDVSVFVLKSQINTNCDLCQEEQELIALQKKEKAELENKKILENKLIEERFKQALIPPRFKLHNFDTYIATTKEEIDNKQKIIDYTKNFLENFSNGNSIVLAGMVGTGKTHLSCAVANYVIKNFNKTALFIDVIDVFAKIKATYSKNSEITEIEAINHFIDIDLLILDEFGVQYGTEAEKIILFRIINKRYQNLKPTIINTNLSLVDFKKFEPRIFDRLKDGGLLLNFVGESKRKSK